MNDITLVYDYSDDTSLKLYSQWSDELAEDLLSMYGINIGVFLRAVMSKKLNILKGDRVTGTHQMLLSCRYDQDVNFNVFTYTEERDES
jgi:hypothetical protein